MVKRDKKTNAQISIDDDSSLSRFAWLSIAAAISTLGLKSYAFFLTNSVSMLSDAMESFVNLAASIVVLMTLHIAHKPPDEKHLYGHSKAEYFSSIIEGILILVAAILIGIEAIRRFLHPEELLSINFGLIISVVASLINFFVARILMKAGRKHHSITLKADAHHLFTDVLTSAGVILADIAIHFTGFTVIDPVIALFVAGCIVHTGFKLIKQSAGGFMDAAIPPEEMQKVKSLLDEHCSEHFQYHALRTRQAGKRRFISVQLLMPGNWSVRKGHNLAEKIEENIRREIPHATTFTHIEPIEDEISYKDIALDR